MIKKEEKLRANKVTILDRLNSGIVNVLFYPIFVKSKKFYTKNTCISCGKCEKVCPTKNIIIENKKPKWDKKCVHCMACISRCPTCAIEYGKHSIELPKYTCPKRTDK